MAEVEAAAAEEAQVEAAAEAVGGEEEGEEEEADSFKRALLEVVSSSQNMAALDTSTAVLGIE